MKGLYLLSFWIFMCCTNIQAQENTVQLQSFGMEQGLSSRIIYTIIQDGKGFVWVGTDYGLNRFDGQHFKVYTKEEYGLSSNRIYKIVTDVKGRLWLSATSLLATYQGASAIDIFDPVKEQSSPLLEWVANPELLKGQQALEVFQGKEGQLFLTTLAGNIYKIEGRLLALYAKTPQPTIITDLQDDGQGLWVATTQAILYFNQQGELQQEKTTKHNNYLSPYLQEVTAANYIDYTIGPNNRQKSGRPHEVRRLYKNGADVLLWKVSAKYIFLFADVATQAAGVIDEQSLEFGLLSFKDTLAPTFNGWGITMTAAYQEVATLWDRQGGFWFDDAPNGIARASQMTKHFKPYLHHYFDDQHTLATRGIVQDSTGMLFIATPTLDGVIKVHRDSAGKGERIRLKVMDEYKILSLLLQGDTLLLGASGGVVLLYDIRNNMQIGSLSYATTADEAMQYPTHSFRHWSLYEDRRQRVWIGHQHGISYIDRGTNQLQIYRKLNGFEELQNATVYQFHEHEQDIWVVSSTGLYLLQPDKGIVKRFHKEDAHHYLPHSELLHLHEDASGDFWLATKGGGLIRWNPQSYDYEQFTTADGLSHNVIYAVYEDDYQHLWISSNRGIIRFNKETKLLNTYLTHDGITHEEFNRVSHYQTPDGTIYFGSLNGVTAFHPKDFWNETGSDLDQAPEITSFSIQHGASGNWDNLTSSLHAHQKIILKPEDLGFSLQFASLDFKSLKKQQYAYMIGGFDKGWIYQSSPQIRVSKLPYGQFKLLIKAQNSNGRWGKTLSIDIKVIKPFYLQPWFLLLSVALGLLLVFLLIKWRTYRLKEYQKILETEVAQRTLQIEKDKETILYQKEELAKLDRLKSRFFANISHELRTPLSLILGPAKYAQAKDKDLGLAEAMSYFELIEQHGEGLLALVEELLDLTRLEENRIKINTSSVNLQDFIYHIWASFQSHATYLGIDYRLENWEEAGDLVLLDVEKVKKIINNLISNALKFTPKKGEVAICAFKNALGNIQIQVTDTGRGVHPLDLPYLFDRFYQSKQEDASELGGMGIGLALAKELTEVMQGELTAESTLGQGSTFILTLPLQQASTAQEVRQLEEIFYIPAPAEEEAQSKAVLRASILLVEDNLGMQKFIAHLLKNDYHLITANNGKEAQNLLSSDTPPSIDLIISDVMMPEMDGFALLKWLKKHPTWRITPVVMLTAKVAEEDKIHALTVGVDDYLTKPFSHLELKARVENLLMNAHARQEWLMQEQVDSKANIVPYLAQEGGDKEGLEVTEGDLQWISSVASTLRAQLADPSFSLQQVAEAFHLSERQFQRKIKKITGLTPVKYKQEIQLYTSRQLLEKGKYKSLSQVANAVGFHTPRYFVKLFTERFGKNPNDYFS